MNISKIASQYPATLSKDARRIGLYGAACMAKVLTLTQTDPSKVIPFVVASSALDAKWAQRAIELGNWQKLLAWIGRDPFYDLRQEVRRFAVEWDMDADFRKEMG